MPLSARRLLFPIEQAARELRQPTRRRAQQVRVGMSLAGMPTMTRSLRHWITTSVGTPCRTGPVWGVVVARNEEVRLPGSIRHLIDQGVDHVVVADNGSTDHTADLVAEMADELPVTLLQDREPGYYHARKVSRMARAATRRGASWIVPFDADELWYGAGERLSDVLRAGRGDIYPAPMFDHRPSFDLPDTNDPYVEIIDRTVLPGPNKVAMRAHLLTAVHQGNHWLNDPGVVQRGALEIRHFPYLGLEHLRRKVEYTVSAYRHTDFGGDDHSYIIDWEPMNDAELRRAAGPPAPMVTDPAPLGPGVVGTILVPSGPRQESRTG
jgi:hypothetical protein